MIKTPKYKLVEHRETFETDISAEIIHKFEVVRLEDGVIVRTFKGLFRDLIMSCTYGVGTRLVEMYGPTQIRVYDYDRTKYIIDLDYNWPIE